MPEGAWWFETSCPAKKPFQPKALLKSILSTEDGFPGWLLVNVMRCHAIRTRCKDFDGFCALLILESSFGVCNNVHENAITLK